MCVLNCAISCPAATAKGWALPAGSLCVCRDSCSEAPLPLDPCVRPALGLTFTGAPLPRLVNEVPAQNPELPPAPSCPDLSCHPLFEQQTPPAPPSRVCHPQLSRHRRDASPSIPGNQPLHEAWSRPGVRREATGHWGSQKGRWL